MDFGYVGAEETKDYKSFHLKERNYGISENPGEAFQLFKEKKKESKKEAETEGDGV